MKLREFDLCTLYKDNLLLDKCLQQYFEKKSQKIESKACCKQKETLFCDASTLNMNL